MSKAWIPLEGNPDIWNEFSTRLGVKSEYEFIDVYGTDPELLLMVPQPVLSIVLLFPITPKYEEKSKNEIEELKSKNYTCSSEVFFIPQTISNACGTMALLHSLGNSTDRLQIADGSVLGNLLEKTKLPDAGDVKSVFEHRAKAVELCDELRNLHADMAKSGTTDAPDPSVPVNLHFITFVNSEGTLYELDGRKPFPIEHGKTSAESYLNDAIAVCRKFMDSAPETVQFSIIAWRKSGNLQSPKVVRILFECWNSVC